MHNAANLFHGILDSLVAASVHPRERVLAPLERIGRVSLETLDDDELYRRLAVIPFYAGKRAVVVSARRPIIERYFPKAATAAAHGPAMIERMLNDPAMFRHRPCIEAAIANARTVLELVQRHGSFKAYLVALRGNESPAVIERAAKELQRRFKRFGEATAHHFLTDIGAPTVKPDRVLLRVFSRLGLIDSEADLEGARRVGDRIARETGYSHRFVDIVLVKFGQVGDEFDLGIGTGLCLEQNPRCEKCLVRQHCRYRFPV